jgi:hypothetical protein
VAVAPAAPELDSVESLVSGESQYCLIHVALAMMGLRRAKLLRPIASLHGDYAVGALVD